MIALVIDHRDSFVFNLVEDLERQGCRCVTVRSDISPHRLRQTLEALSPHLLVLSPGPGRPEDAGVMPSLLQHGPDLPVLGVCLGMQVMVTALGGVVAPARRPVHGEAHRVRHEGHPLFAGIPRVFPAARYHSLVARDVPDELEVLARTEDEPALAMAVHHRTRPWIGLQFHPESVLTPNGPTLLQNILGGIPCP